MKGLLRLVQGAVPVVLIVGLIGGGCATARERRARRMPEVIEALSTTDHDRLMVGTIAIGDTPEMVYLAWGRPDRRSRIVRPDGESEVWTWFDYRGEYIYPAVRPLSHRGGYDRMGWRVFPDFPESDWYFVPVPRGTVEFREGEVVSFETAR